MSKFAASRGPRRFYHGIGFLLIILTDDAGNFYFNAFQVIGLLGSYSPYLTNVLEIIYNGLSTRHYTQLNPRRSSAGDSEDTTF
jgi:hypothetical protein